MSNTKKIKLTVSQERVFCQIKDFLKGKDRVFILKGYAGTGKTTMMRFLIEYLNKQKRGYHLLASTGRAATVLDKATGSKNAATTIHSMIYRYSDFNQDVTAMDLTKQDIHGQLYLVFEAVKASGDDKEQVYIIDEASMISDIESRNIVQAAFGSGRLLKELLEYDADPGAKFIFVGDPCQLPPIDQPFSPALSAEYIRATFRLGVQQAQLTEIIRQGDGNSIIVASQRIRQLYAKAPDTDDYYRGGKNWCRMPIARSENILLHPNRESLLDGYLTSVREHGYSYATFVCRSNKECYTMALNIRQLLGKQGAIAQDDLLLVIQNNAPAALYNGDLVVVKEFAPTTESRAGLTFRKVKVQVLGGDITRSALLIEEVLHSGKLNLDNAQQKALFVDFIMRMKRRGITQKDKQQFTRAMMSDPYLNALRCTFGYAITCHKTQGGEWPEVFVQMPRNIMLNPTKSSYQWVYTAITRARQTLHIVDDIYLESFRRW